MLLRTVVLLMGVDCRKNAAKQALKVKTVLFGGLLLRSFGKLSRLAQKGCAKDRHVSAREWPFRARQRPTESAQWRHV